MIFNSKPAQLSYLNPRFILIAGFTRKYEAEKKGVGTGVLIVRRMTFLFFYELCLLKISPDFP
jgi:hypothetical protein